MVISYLENDKELSNIILLAADDVPTITKSLSGIKNVFVEPPNINAKKQKNLGKKHHIKRPGTNYSLREAANKKLGKAGEEFVLEVEKGRLLKANCFELSKSIEWVSQTIGDGLGYDIRSFFIDGSPKYIEVKTTTRGKFTPFIISFNDKNFCIKYFKIFFKCLKTYLAALTV